MKDDSIDSLLGNDKTVVPSEDFALKVMQRVRREAQVPSAISFPWKQAFPGLCAVTALAAAILTGSIQEIASTGSSLWALRVDSPASGTQTFEVLILAFSVTVLTLLVAGSTMLWPRQFPEWPSRART